MGRKGFRGDQRSVSEIYGTVLVISLAFVTALLLVGGGWVIIDQITVDTQDSLAQDSMQEMDANLDELTGSQVNSSTEFSFPDDTGADVSTAPDNGTVTIEVTTNESYQDLVEAHNGGSYDNASLNLTLGTILHENDDSVITAYQGGGLWERQDDFVRVLSPPSFDYNGQTIDFGFVNLSEMAAITEGQELRAEHDIGATRDREQAILNEIDPHWNITGANALAPVSVNVTIESQFAQGWAEYARNRMTESPVVDYPYKGDSEKVKIIFGEIPPDSSFPTAGNFTYPILYAGESQWAYELQNESHTYADIEDISPGFKVVLNNTNGNPSPHMELAVYDNNASEWRILMNNGNNTPDWINVSGDSVPVPDPVINADPAKNEYHIEDGAYTCVVSEHQIGNNGEGVLTEDSKTGRTLLELCAIEGMTDDSEGAPMPDFDTNFEINITGTDPPAPDREVTEGDPVKLDVNVNNTGSVNDTQDVGLYYFTEANEPILVDYEEDLELDASENESLDLEWSDTAADINSSGSEVTLFAVGEDDFDEVTVNVTSNESEYEVEIEETDDPVEEGDELEVTSWVNNTGTADGNQITYLEGPDGNILDSAEIDVDANENETVDFTWNTSSGDESSSAELTVRSDSDDDSTNVTVAPSDTGGEPVFIVDIEKDSYVVDFEDDTLNLEVTVENVGGADGTQDIGLFNLDDELVDVVEDVDVDEGESKTVTLAWVPDEDDAGREGTVTVRSADDVDTATVEVDESLALESNFVVEIDGTDDLVEEGEPFNVDAYIENTGGIEDTQLIPLYDVDGNIVDVREVKLGPGASTTRTLTWSDPTDLDPEATNEIEVRSEDDNATQSVDIASQLLVRSFDTERNGNTVTATNITVENVGDQKLDQQVVLEDFDGNEVDSIQSGNIDPGEVKTLKKNKNKKEELTWKKADERTGNVTVRTEDDALEQVVLYERDGPECDTVSYDIDSDGYRKVETVDQLQCIEYADGTHDTREDSLAQDYRLYDDINAYGTQFWNDGDGFVPIGAQEQNEKYEFAGDFDGQGNKIEGMHINRTDESFVGIFASTNYFDDGGEGEVGAGSTVGSVRLVDIDVRGKTVVGGLVAAAGGTVDNSSVEGYIESEYQQVGGLVGHAHDADLNNRLVSRATVIGSYPACADNEHPWQNSNGNLGVGGIVGGTGFETDVSTAYSLATVRGASAVGGITGWTSDFSSTNLQMYWAAGELELVGERRLDECGRENLDDDPTAGAIAGRMEIDDDNFKDSVYWDRNFHPHGNGEQEKDADPYPRTTENMTGLDVKTPDKVGNLTFRDEGGPWVAVPDDYPRFFWELEAEGAFVPTIESTNSPETVGDTLEVTATIENTYLEDETQTIVLLSPDGDAVDTEEVTLPGGDVDNNPSTQIDLDWDTSAGDDGVDDITVTTEDALDTEQVEIKGVKNDDSESEFEVEITDTNSPVTAGDDLDADLTIENTGSDSDEQTVYLTDFEGNIVGSAEVDLDEGETQNETITWVTDASDDGTGEITAHTEDDTNSTEVTVEEADDSNEVMFEITKVVPADPVDEGDDLDVKVTVNNTGDTEGTQFVVLSEDTDFPPILGKNELTLDANESETFDLTWQTESGDGDGDPQEITVHTEDDTNSTEVTVEPVGQSNFEVEITNTNSPVTVPGTLNVTVDVENTGDAEDTQFVYLEHPTKDNVILDIVEITDLSPGNSEKDIELQWEEPSTYEGKIEVYTDDDSDSKLVFIELPSGVAPGEEVADPIDVNLEQIRIS